MPPETTPSRGTARVPYDRQTLGHPNALARFAHRQRHRISLALAARHVVQGGTMVDFGAGTGVFLHQLGAQRPDLRLLAFEPFMTIGYPGIDRLTQFDTLPDGSVDAVSAFEVCEHLDPAQVADFLRQARRLLRPTGRLIVSVPIMEGLALPIKEVIRATLFRRASDHSGSDLVRATLGRPVARAADILSSHKGFAHRLLWARIERDFRSVAAHRSPWDALPWWVNSQRFGVFEPRPQ